MPNRVPSLTIYSPKPDAVVGLTPFSVTGLVTAPGMPEPVAIDSVTVQVDSQPPVQATLNHIVSTSLVEVTFSATVQIAGGQDPHTITVTVESDAGIPVRQSVTVTAGLRLAPPAVLIDLAPIANIPANSHIVQHMLSVIAKQMGSLSLVNDLANLNKIVVGPNAIAISAPRSMLRIGVWILDGDFPQLELLPPSPPDFPLPRLTDDAAAQCFSLSPLLSPPPPGGVPPADNALFGFAMSVPTSTLQLILDAMFPQIKAKAADHDFKVESAVITTDSTGSVTTTLSGSPSIGFSLTASLTENLGVVQAPNTVQMMPAVVSSSHSTDVGSLLDWIIGTLVPEIGLFLVAEFGVAAYGVGLASDKANGVIGSYLGSLRPILPFRNTSLPSKADFPDLPFDPQARYSFPMAVLNFETFTTDGSGIVASGTVGIGERDQSMVAVHLGGPTYYPNYSYGIESAYAVGLSFFEPDSDEMTWSSTGSQEMNGFTTNSFWQRGSFADFPIPAKAHGKYHFTLSVSGTETCGTDPTKQLSGTAALGVTVNLTKDPPRAPQLTSMGEIASASSQP
jgi:hypothetical protein